MENMKLAGIRDRLEKPFWAHEGIDFPSWDFNREILAPGINDMFPDGATGIRIDGDFWVCAILPYEIRDYTVKDLVEELWPEMTDKAFYKPDSDHPYWDMLGVHPNTEEEFMEKREAQNQALELWQKETLCLATAESECVPSVLEDG